MNDNEILETLECIRNAIELGEQMPMSVQFITDVLDLINRKDEEIDALIAGQETLQKNLPKVIRVGFVKRLKEKVKHQSSMDFEDLDNLLDEMEGELWT